MWAGGYQARRICPSPGVRDELTAQLLFQLHGLFENNVMSFITDNPRKWLLWQPGKRIALTSQSEVPVMPPVFTNSLSSLGAPPILCLGKSLGRRRKKRGKWRDHSVKRKRTNEETETPGEEGLQEWAVSPKFPQELGLCLGHCSFPVLQGTAGSRTNPSLPAQPDCRREFPEMP